MNVYLLHKGIFMSIGYRMVDFDFDKLQLQTKQFKHKLDANSQMGVITEFDKGLFLGSSESFLEYYESGADPDERFQDVKLAYEFDDADIMHGNTTPDTELVVSKAKLVGAEFYDEELQEKWGHLLNKQLVVNRQNAFQVEELKLFEGAGHVVRAQSAMMDFIVEGDYCYQHNGLGAYRSNALRVIDMYDQGDEPRSAHDKIFLKALEHAVTMAVTSCEKQQVVLYPVTQGEVFKASNAGELLYSGKPKQGRVVFDVSPEGVPSLPELPNVKRQQSFESGELGL